MIFSFPVYLVFVCCLYAGVRQGLRRSMDWLHTWSGLLLGWVLYLVFLTGTTAYYKAQITQWMQPEARATLPPADFVSRALDALEREAPDANYWVISIPHRRNDTLSIQWGESTSTSALSTSLFWDADSEGFVPVRETAGGEYLFRFHYHLQMGNWGIWLVGLATMTLCVALVSGVIIHRKLFRDFFTLRLRSSASRGWLDLHNLTGTLALPFHLMIAWTGLITLMGSYMPLAPQAVYGEEAGLLYQESYPAARPVADPAAARDPVGAVRTLLQGPARVWDANQVERIVIGERRDAVPTLEFWPRLSGDISRFHSHMPFEGEREGIPLRESVDYGPGVATQGAMAGLHLAQFASTGLRALFMLCGLAGTVMIGSGLVLWVHKRSERTGGNGIGIRLVEGLNVATLIGGPVAIAAFFIANRVLPVALENRAAWEGKVFVGALGLMVVHGLISHPARAWRQQTALAAMLFALLPVLNATLTQRGLVASLQHGDRVFAGFDLLMIALALGFAWLWQRLSGKRTESSGGAARAQLAAD